MLTAEISTGYTVMNEADRTPALEELIIYRKGLQNTAPGQIQARNGVHVFKGLFCFVFFKNQVNICNRKCACLQSLNYLLSGVLQKKFATPGLKGK